MKPRITFHYNKKTTSLDVRIKINSIPPGLYSTGISISARSFDQEKQICGDPSVQVYMNITRDTLEKMFRPGMTPEQMWANYTATATGVNQTIEDAFTYYLTTMKLAPSTKRNFENTKAKIAAGGILSTSISAVNAAMVRKFLNTQKGESSTIHLTYIQLKTVIRRYVKDHNLKDIANIDDIIEAPKKADAEEGEEEYLTFAEIKELMALELSPKLAYARDMFVITCFTGMAVIDLIKFTPEWISADGEWIVYLREKTKHTNRKCSVPMMPITRKLIFKYEWPTKLAKRTMQYNCEQLGKLIGRPITTHTGRHSFGSTMLYFGFSMESVCKMMGHASIRTTEQIYAKVSKEKIEREMKSIPQQMNEAFGT